MDEKWTASYSQEDVEWVVMSDNGRAVAFPTNQRYAKRIAALPELVEALKHARQYVVFGKDNNFKGHVHATQSLAIIDEALAKMEGAI